MLLSSAAYITGYFTSGDGLVFSGAVVDRMDYSVHLATMHLGERGEWRYYLRFTGEPQQGAFVKSGYLFLGHTARWLGINLPTSYQLARVILGLLVCMLVYVMAAYVFYEPAWRRLAWLLAVAGGGLGWMQSVLGWVPQADLSPVDFWLVDAYTFFGMVTFPHFLAVTILLLIVILIGLKYLMNPAIWHWPAAAGSVICMQFIQPFAPVLADMALLGLFTLHGMGHPGRRLRSGMFLTSFGLAQLPVLLYNLTVFSSGSDWTSFTAQNITLSPPPVYYLWGFAPFWIPALAGGFWLAARWWGECRGKETPVQNRENITYIVSSAMLAWALGAMLLAYAPTALQRRFLLAYTIPLGLLAAAGLRFVLLPWVKAHGPAWFRTRPMLAPVLITALACIYAPVLALGQSMYVATRPADLFDSTAWIQAVDWLKANAGEDDLVLASEPLSRLIAARAGLPVYSGHPMETLNYARKSQQVELYFSGELDDEWLYQTGTRWVVFTEADHPQHEAGQQLQLKYDQNGVEIFEALP